MTSDEPLRTGLDNFKSLFIIRKVTAQNILAHLSPKGKIYTYSSLFCNHEATSAISIKIIQNIEPLYVSLVNIVRGSVCTHNRWILTPLQLLDPRGPRSMATN